LPVHVLREARRGRLSERHDQTENRFAPWARSSSLSADVSLIREAPDFDQFLSLRVEQVALEFAQLFRSIFKDFAMLHRRLPEWVRHAPAPGVRGFGVLAACAWWVYVVYLPIFAVEQGLGEQLGANALSLTNGLLFATPLMLGWMHRRSVRYAVRFGFLTSACLFLCAAIFSAWPWTTIGLLVLGSTSLVLLDISAGLPFLMAVKPSERTEMSAVYSIYRDVSAILMPGVAWAVLLLAPVSGLFAAAGAGLLLSWAIAARLYPRLGKSRPTGEPSGHIEAAA
jgi:hypothetical protein